MELPRRAAVLALVVALLAGCAGETPSASVPGSGPGSTAPSLPPSSPSPAASTASPQAGEPSLEPIPAPTVVPPGAPFEVSWTELAGREAPSVEGSLSDPFAFAPPTSVRFGGGAVVAYPTNSVGSTAGPMIWWSPDLVTWRRALPAEAISGGSVWAKTVVVGGPGVAVLGANANESGDIDLPRLWTSADGEHWQVGIAPSDARFIWGRPGRLVVFGRSTWVSADGRTWAEKGPSPFATAEFLQQARAVIVEDGDGAIVLARVGFDAPTSVHRLGSDGSWEQWGFLEGYVSEAVRGPTGIVALGNTLGDEPKPMTWTSVDGRTWDPHVGAAPGGTLVASAVGYVAVGKRIYYQGCDGFDPSMQVVNTWTSPDGIAWKLMAEDGAQDHVDLPVVLPDGDRLVAIGLKWASEGGGDEFENRSTPSVWASSPLVPPKEPAPEATASGCGGD